MILLMRARVAVMLLALNAAILGALIALSFDPQRMAFGRATGLWHHCKGTAAMSYGSCIA